MGGCLAKNKRPVFPGSSSTLSTAKTSESSSDLDTSTSTPRGLTSKPFHSFKKTHSEDADMQLVGYRPNQEAVKIGGRRRHGEMGKCEAGGGDVTGVRLHGELAVKGQEQFDDKNFKSSEKDMKLGKLHKAGLAVSCKKGKKQGLPNQDDYCLALDKHSLLVGVFDGHGLYGHHVSNYTAKNLLSTLPTHPDYLTDTLKAISESISICNSTLVDTSKQKGSLFNCESSGTTATVAVVGSKDIALAHLGDSRAVIGKVMDTGDVVAKPLTRDHKPNIPSEYKRILLSDGEVRKESNDCDWRIYYPGKNYPGLALSRSLGDTVASQIGLTSEPDTLHYQIAEEDQFLLICSDGVWEFLSDQEAVKIIAEHGRANLAAGVERLCQTAYSKWMSSSEIVDDITVAVVYLPASSSEELQ